MTYIQASSERWPHITRVCCVCHGLDAKRTYVGTYYCKSCANGCKDFLARRAAAEKAREAK